MNDLLKEKVMRKELDQSFKQRAYNQGICPECGSELVTKKYQEKKIWRIFYNEGQLLQETYCPQNKQHCHTKIHLETW
jgi:hypothetical protein